MNNFNTLLNTISVLDFDPDKAIILLEYLIKYRDAQVNDFNRVAFALEDAGERIDELNAENEALTKKVGELERALKAVKLASKNTITLDICQIFKKASELETGFFHFVKWVRNDGAVFSDGAVLGLYEAKFLSDYVFAYFDYKPMVNLPSRGEKTMLITWNSEGGDVKWVIEKLLEFNYPGYEIVWA